MEWKNIHISDIGKVITGKTPRTAITENYGGTIPFLTPSDNLSQKSAPNTIKKLTEQGLDEVKNCLLPPHSVCISCIGSDLGKVVVTLEPTVTNQQFNSIIPNNDFDTDFVYYLMTLVGKELNYLSKTSTAVPIINKSTFSNYDVAVPDLETQVKIASVLSSLDAKIETNNRLSEDLEELAQAIFKSWFVDFKPFKNGNFVDSELGMIPEGWEVGKIGDLCTFKRGKGLLSKDAILGDVPVVAGGMQPSCYHNVANTQAPVVTVSGSGANAGFTRLYHVNVWASDCSFIDRNCENLYFVYCYLIRNKRLLKHAQTGAVQPHVKPADIHNFETVIPPKDILVQFNSIIEELLSQNGIFEKENQRLANLRDTILPRLMSGEIKL